MIRSATPARRLEPGAPDAGDRVAFGVRLAGRAALPGRMPS